MIEISNELFDVAEALKNAASKGSQPEIKQSLSKLEEVATRVGKAWSGSWLGYHSRVYYNDFEPKPPGVRFSQQWGARGATLIRPETVGDWAEYTFDGVYDMIIEEAGNPELSVLKAQGYEARRVFQHKQTELASLLTTMTNERGDSFIERLQKEAEEAQIYTQNDILGAYRPKGQFVTQDMVALGEGVQNPPHLVILSEVLAIRQAFKACEDLSMIAQRAASHVRKQERYRRKDEEIGTNIFIGHGRSPVWRDLKDFLQDRLSLPWDEFNRVPVAGVTNIARLLQMLDEAAFAFLILTAEDEQADGSVHARMNVIHEAGLFQGKLGFSKAIVLLEDGCEEFSNIQGLGQIRFPSGNIKAAFEDIRGVLEREKLLSSSD